MGARLARPLQFTPKAHCEQIWNWCQCRSHPVGNLGLPLLLPCELAVFHPSPLHSYFVIETEMPANAWWPPRALQSMHLAVLPKCLCLPDGYFAWNPPQVEGPPFLFIISKLSLGARLRLWISLRRGRHHPSGHREGTARSGHPRSISARVYLWPLQS